jgi:hypothetical protein
LKNGAEERRNYMKLKVSVKKAEPKKTTKAEVRTEDDNTKRIGELSKEIEVLEMQIADFQRLRIIARKEKFLLENAPYKEGDKIVFNMASDYRKDINLVTGILEYEDDWTFSPGFYVRPYKKGTEELANMRRRVYSNEQIVKLA